jgi:LytTR family transcriptional regulator, CO-responsive transcriptional regulator RcoM
MQQACPHPEAQSAASGSWLYMLERFDIGLVHIDLQLRVVGMNDYARRCLPVEEKMPFGKLVTSFHPKASRAKVQFLIGQAECPVNNAPPMTMIINIPERMLIIKVTKIADERGATTGYTLVFHDITEVISQAPDWKAPRDARENAVAGKRLLRKIPTTRQRRILLVDVPDVSFIRSEGHYTWVNTSQGSHFCNLNIGDLESRLDPSLFLRVHRSYIINLSHVNEILREDGRVSLRMMGPEPVEIPVSRASTPALMDQLGLADATQVKI